MWWVASRSIHLFHQIYIQPNWSPIGEVNSRRMLTHLILVLFESNKNFDVFTFLRCSLPCRIGLSVIVGLEVISANTDYNYCWVGPRLMYCAGSMTDRDRPTAPLARHIIWPIRLHCSLLNETHYTCSYACVGLM